MCRSPAGETTFAISDSLLPYTRTCCEINYAFSSCQARKRALLSKWVGGRKTWKDAQSGADGGNLVCFPGSKSYFWSLRLWKGCQTQHVVDCSPSRKSGVASSLLFHLPEVTLACLIPAAVGCSREESNRLHSMRLKGPFNADGVSALLMSRRQLCRDVTLFIWCSLCRN